MKVLAAQEGAAIRDGQMQIPGLTMGKGKKQRQKGAQGYNRKNSTAFFAKNRKKEGVKETESGLQYLVIEEVEGPKPELDHIVRVHQRITLIDGTVVADTYKESEPVTFTIKEAIEGYREGLLMMNVGSRYRFFIPSDLAWGKRGAGTKIGPYATLIIDVRLLDSF